MKPEPTYEELIYMNSMLMKQLIKALEAIVELTNKTNQPTKRHDNDKR